MKIESGKRVRIKVVLSVVGGDVIEESAVAYFHGAGTMLPGLEEELEGLEAGAKREGTIPAARAFGSPAHQHKKSISRREFPEGELAAGTLMVAKGANGQDVVLRVETVDGDEVEVTMLHPLHDKDIAYKVEVLSVTDPAPPPLPAEAIAAESDD